MEYTITDSVSTINVVGGSESSGFKKENLSFKTFGDTVRFVIDQREVFLVDYRDVVNISVASSEDLKTKLESWIDSFTPSDTSIDTVRGAVSGHGAIVKFGRNPDIDIVTAPADVWNSGGDYTGMPTGSAEAILVVSTSINDTSLGSGARTITISGLDEDYNYQEVSISLNGLTPVVTVEQWVRVNRVKIDSSGSSGNNIGVIAVMHSITTINIFAVVPAGQNQSTIGAYTIPAGKTGYLRSLYIPISRTNGSAGSAEISLRIREFGGVFRAVRYYTATNSVPITPPFKYPITVPEKSDIKIRVESVSDNNTDVTADFEILLIDN